MNTEYLYKDINFCQREFFSLSDCTCDTSLIVPDTKSDIVKIISLKATPVISDTRSEKGRIIISGQVKFNLLYIGEDESSKICTLCITTPFSHTVQTELEDAISLTDVRCLNSSYTLINSRKVKVSAHLTLSGVLYKANRVKALSSAPDAETCTKELTVLFPAVICRKSIALTDSSELPGNNSIIKSVLKTTATVSDYDCKILSNKAIVKGNVLFSVLYLSEDDISTSTVTLPFTEVVEAEGLSHGQDANIDITISDCDAIIDTNLSGEEKMLDISVLLSATITSFIKETVSVVTDIFLPKGCVKTEKTDVLLQSAIHLPSEEEFVKESITLPSPSAFGRILDMDIDVTDIAQSDGLITANLAVTILYLPSTATQATSHTQRITVSHKTTVSSPENIGVTIKHAGYTLSDNSTVEIRLDVCFYMDSDSIENTTVFTSCKIAEYTPDKRPSVIVSFVNKGDTLWSIAKKYNISLSKLAKANDIEESSVLTIGEKLIIPR